MMKPLVSIITVTRNRASLIHRCIESIQNQSYRNYEHIIVDGCSTDDTQDVVLKYNDPKIKYLRLGEYGHKVQLRAAYNLCKADYITFLDDDDEYTYNGLELRINLLLSLNEKYGFVYSSMDYFDEKTKRFLYKHKMQIEDGGLENLHTVLSSPIVCGTPTLLFRREAYYSVSNGTWVNDIGNDGSDMALCAMCIRKGWRFAGLKESTANVYINHSAKRITDYIGENRDGLNRNIKFATHFLNEYKDVFLRYPKDSIIYYHSLINSYLRLRDFKKAFAYFKKLLSINLTFKNFIYPFYVLVRYVCFRKY